MILLIDNYDSFTWNLVQYTGRFYKKIEVHRNDKITIEEIEKKDPRAIIISPGPKTPTEAGISCAVIERFYKEKPIFGVCLGHQAMGQVFGGDVVQAPEIMHGKISQIYHDGEGVYNGLKSPLDVVRYHSLIVKRETLPDCLEITSKTKKGLIMGLRHKDYPMVEGVQFHPESIKTDEGYAMVENFLKNGGIL